MVPERGVVRLTQCPDPVTFAGQGISASLPVTLRWSAAKKTFRGIDGDGGKLSVAESVMKSSMCQDPQHPGRRFEATLSYV
jgi:hypothetical protein